MIVKEQSLIAFHLEDKLLGSIAVGKFNIIAKCDHRSSRRSVHVPGSLLSVLHSAEFAMNCLEQSHGISLTHGFSKPFIRLRIYFVILAGIKLVVKLSDG